VLIRRLLEVFQGGEDCSTLGMSENHHQPGAEPFRCELNATDLRRSDDISGNSDHKQIAETLVKYDLGRHARVGTTQNDGKRLLTSGQVLASRLTR
jgi:hypothetical protein